jgi:hypothetical protein
LEFEEIDGAIERIFFAFCFSTLFPKKNILLRRLKRVF